ncbi:MAG: HIT domain-containing protein [Deltaproteobacteria bacterium]|nr:HIT domain-containing protein [Deltaproteobacteria bacterium]
MFTLDARLDADTLAVIELPLSAVRLMRDANYAWLVLVPRRANAVELVDLGDDDQLALTREIAAASRALRACVPCDKLNVAALGNVVPQLHVHVIARRHSDPAWPRPVWGAVPAVPYPAGGAEALIARISAAL